MQPTRSNIRSRAIPGSLNTQQVDLEREKMENDPTYDPDLTKTPLHPEYNVLRLSLITASAYPTGKEILSLSWKKVQVLHPQALTKVMNEGWACTIHHKIINELNLPDSLHLPFMKLHNQVVRPHLGQLNPYHLGFKLFEKIIEDEGFEEAMIVREVHNDISFLRFYIDEKFMQDMNYFSYSFKKTKKAITIDDVSDDDGWEKSVTN
jgi:stage V sporulation protein R